MSPTRHQVPFPALNLVLIGADKGFCADIFSGNLISKDSFDYRIQGPSLDLQMITRRRTLQPLKGEIRLQMLVPDAMRGQTFSSYITH